ncbi:hypothetical protein BURCENK562V_C0529 [Burkholderia cenocepacia K56-2Valvano]|nr:hypothetical protein BURCENK562V_C0529 [Burkholderia cenocepacia K56-2Valvano]
MTAAIVANRPAPRREDFRVGGELGARAGARSRGRRAGGAQLGPPRSARVVGSAGPGRRPISPKPPRACPPPASRPFIVPSRFLSILSRAAHQAVGAPRRHSCVSRVS